MQKYLAKDYFNMNRVLLSWYEIKFRNYYLQKFPWIEKIQFSREKNTLDIKVIGRRPEVYLSIDNWLLAIAGSRLLPVKGTLNTTGTRIPVVEIIGSRISSTGSLDSLFFWIRSDAFVRQISLIHENISDYELLQFIPWGNKILLKTKDWVSLYFDARKNMIEQINKYRLISWSGSVIGNNKIIDLGTMDDIIFMSK